MSLKKIAVACAVMAIAGTASAGIVNLSTGSGAGGAYVDNDAVAFGPITHSGSITAPGTSFTDTINFALGDFSFLTGGVTPNRNYTFSSVVLKNSFGVTMLDADASVGGIDYSYLQAGNYHFEVAGKVIGASKNYFGTFSVTAVPEPESYAMFLAGIGALGFMARRRRVG